MQWQHPLCNTYRGMKARCLNPRHLGYKNYGGRGVIICERWLRSFEAFVQDVGPRPGPEYTLDRYPNADGNYERGNVRWATRLEQAHNKRSSAPHEQRYHNSAKAHCHAGHPFSPENIYWRPGGRRDCRACRRLARRRYLSQRKGG
jgi:hypothetical protein